MSGDTKVSAAESALIAKDEFTCPLCQCLLFEPVTTPCGHTYCRECILRALDHNTSCPMCRTTVNMLPDHAINVLVSTIIQKCFADEYKQRLNEAQTMRDHTFQLPIFMLDYVLFPGMPLHLHVFEPRYRLMVRRCLEGTRTFGVLLSVNGEPSKIGTTTVIESSNVLPDGRQILVTKGERRFKVLSFGQQDGYTTAKVKYIEDDDEEESSDNVLQVAKAKRTLNKYLSSASAPETGNTEIMTMADLTQRFGTMPARPKAFSFWISSILSVPHKQKQDLLELTKTKQRLTRAIEALGLTTGNTKGCTIS